MATRFRRTMKIAPGVKLNLGKRGPSLTVGGKFGRITTGASGTHIGASVPGTGLYATQKIGAAPDRQARTRATTATATAGTQVGTIRQLMRSVPPKERGIDGLFAALGNPPKRQAVRIIEQAAQSPSVESDSAVAAAVALAPESWTVQREAGLYFVSRENPAAAVSYLGAAANLFPGDRTLYYLAAADAGVDSGAFDYSIGVLQPLVSAANPESDLGALILTSLANACLKSGDHGRALELLGRLPLRRRNLSDILLFGLCVRACANRAAGKKAQAKKDIDRVYASCPDFPMLEAASREALAD